MKVGPVAALSSALLLAAASLAVAQQSASSPPPLPPAPAALAVPNPLAGLQPGVRDLYQSPDGSDRFQHISPHPVPPVIIVPGIYVPGSYYMPVAATHEYPPHRSQVAVARGGLVLQTFPDAAQVFVDGFYLGLAEEFGLRGRAVDLSAGAHYIELRASGYQLLSFSVMIRPNEILRYRGDMLPLASPAPPRMPPQLAAQKSFYVIPNCYAGDRPPTGALPAGCDLKNLRTRR